MFAPLPASLSLFAYDGNFPHGPGWYLAFFRLGLVLAALFAWGTLCQWIDDDQRELEVAEGPLWNMIALGTGALGAFLLFAVPAFWFVWLLIIVALAVEAKMYANVRNLLVKDTGHHLLTPEHFKRLAKKYLKLDFSEEGGPRGRNIPIIFVGKRGGASNAETNKFLTKSEESAGYQSALELIWNALKMRVTDIHLEPTKDETLVRFRIDGIMKAQESMDRRVGDSVLNILKVVAELDITEKRKPQDGSFQARVLDPDRPKSGGRLVDFRVATSGSVAGEKMVLRILDQSKAISNLDDLGFRPKVRDQIRSIVGSPHGLFLVCGPTGAGKSTTLYASLHEIDRFTKNVITLENPVEYAIANTTQIEVNAKSGKTFAGELRSILRQDPDVIYIGEIRDKETAEIACQAAQTGHMVFSTIHSNDAVSALSRLIELGVDPSVVANSLSGILGQRLVRKLCPKCKEKYTPSPDALKRLNLPVDKIKFLCKAPGEGTKDSEQNSCEYCGGSGYRGRNGVYELFVISDKIREMIESQSKPNNQQIQQEAIKEGMSLLFTEGLRQVISGDTSIAEITRVCK
jgi:type II secretory ATPase GspE/PulE/Tfp pilus assembly ATPase PilB-like protein